MVKSLRILIVGGGSIGERHLQNLLALGCKHIGILDIDPKRRIALQSTYGIQTILDLDQAIAYQPDLSFICTPNHLHLSIALELAEAKSHLFIEKPLAIELEGIDRLQRQVEQFGLFCCVACNMRFHPAIRRLKEQLDTGAIGVPYFVQTQFGHYLPNWRPQQDYRKSYSSRRDQGGGILFDAIHDIDYLIWFCGTVRHIHGIHTKISDLEIETEDMADILLRFDNGVHGSIHLDYLDRVKRRSCQIVGSQGTLIWRSIRKQPEQAIIEFHQDNERSTFESLEIDPNEEYMAQLRYLLHCVRTESPPMLNLHDAVKVLKVIQAINTSSREKRSVSLEGQ